MGIYCGTVGVSDDKKYSCRVGNNGSQACVMALLFAAYTLDKQSESKRVMRKWLEPVQRPETMTLSELPTAYHTRNEEWVRKLIAFNYDNRMWFKYTTGYWITVHGFQIYQTAGVELALKFKKPKCPKLTLLVDIYNAINDSERTYGHVSSETTYEVAFYIRHLVDSYLKPSCWYGTMDEIAKVFEVASSEGGGVRIG